MIFKSKLLWNEKIISKLRIYLRANGSSKFSHTNFPSSKSLNWKISRRITTAKRFQFELCAFVGFSILPIGNSNEYSRTPIGFHFWFQPWSFNFVQIVKNISFLFLIHTTRTKREKNRTQVSQLGSKCFVDVFACVWVRSNVYMDCTVQWNVWAHTKIVAHTSIENDRETRKSEQKSCEQFHWFCCCACMFIRVYTRCACDCVRVCLFVCMFLCVSLCVHK